MSEVAGRMAAQEAAKYLERSQGGRGVLLGGVPGVAPAMVLVLGGGTVGTEAARIASGLGATVYLLDTSLPRLRHLAEIMPKNCLPLMSTPATIRELAQKADAIIGAVLLPGAKAPKLVNREMLATMKKGTVLVDVAIDQGGCFETSHATTHADPTYIVEGIVHYCVANMPGAVARTSTYALNNVTLPHALRIADLGWKEALKRDTHLAQGLNVWNGKVTFEAVAEAVGTDYVPVDQALA
jgi:alanine dehydrogenase